MDRRLGHDRSVAAMALIAFVSVGAVTLTARRLQKANSVHAAIGKQVTTETSGFYCNLKALSMKERARHMQLTYEIERAKVETVEVANGLAFRFQDGAISLAELAEWVSAERKCCPFFDFEIEQQADNGPLWLKLRGKDGVKDFMRSEFRIR